MEMFFSTIEIRFDFSIFFHGKTDCKEPVQKNEIYVNLLLLWGLKLLGVRLCRNFYM